MDKNDKIIMKKEHVLSEILSLLEKLVNLPSPSKREDKVKEFVYDYLKKYTSRILVKDLFIATNFGKDLIVCTHLDTVEGNTSFSFDGKWVYGTGCCDAKASLTAMLLAFKLLYGEPEFDLAFFCDEEEDGTGSKEFVKFYPHGKFCIVMEPTELKICSRHFGSVELEIMIEGEASHGAFEESGINAIYKAFDFIKTLKGKGFDFNLLKIEGGTEKYVIPEWCKLKLEFFLKPEEEKEEFLKNLKFVKFWGEAEIENDYSGYVSKGVHKILEKAIKKAGLSLSFAEMRSWTDALNLKERFDVVVWGPGELPPCHTKKEKIDLKEILKSVKVLIELHNLLKSQ